MVVGNVIFLNPSKEFTPQQRQMIRHYVSTYAWYLRKKANVVFGFSDEGHEYCSVINDDGDVVAHYAKTDTHYVAECCSNGFVESSTLFGVLITSQTPREVVKHFEDNRKASA